MSEEITEQTVYTGFHAIEERVKRFSQNFNGERPKIFYSKKGPRVAKILSLAQSAKIPVETVTDSVLDSLVKNLPQSAQEHRGIILTVQNEKSSASNIVSLQEWLNSCPKCATVVLLDGITDPHNIGAILRSCDQLGGDLLIVPERNSVRGINQNQIIARASAGAASWVSLAVVPNLVRAVELLRQNGFWIFAADAKGTKLGTTSFTEKTCIVMGSEGNGISRLLLQNCDSVLSIPTSGKIDSLNVSVAAGIFLYERRRQLLEN